MKLHHVPHLVLGVSTQASPDEASLGFARSTKRLKQSTETPFSVEDLTSALAMLEGSGSLDAALIYNLPADPAILDGWTPEAAEAARLQSADNPEEAAVGFLHQALREMLTWEWEAAESSCKEVLRLGQREEIRDEALNVLALSLAMRGESQKAISALKQAVEGEWNLALQQNLGILAIETDPELAAVQATYWLDSAATPEDRESAILRILGMWMSLQSDSDEDDGDEVAPPPRILEALRQAMHQDLSQESFQTLGTFLARTDREWVLKASNWARSPHGATASANIIYARAEGLEEYVEYLVENARSQTVADRNAINQMLLGMNDLMLREQDATGPASVCIGLFDGGLDFSSFERVLARPLAVREICLSLVKEEAEPLEQVLDWLIEARRATPALDLSPESKQMLQEIHSSAGDIASAVYHDSRINDARQVQQSLMEINALHASSSGRRQINRAGLREAARNMQNWCSDTRRIHGKCMEVCEAPDLRTAWSEFMAGVSGLEANVRNYL